MSEETKLPAIPDVPADAPPGVCDFLSKIRQILIVREGVKGDPLDQNVTYRELHAAGVIGTRDGNGNTYYPTVGENPLAVAVPVAPVGETPDLSTPPDVEGFGTRGGLSCVFVYWDKVEWSNHGYTEVWRSATNSLTTAALVGTTTSNTFADTRDAVDVDARGGYYFARHVSKYAVLGAFTPLGVYGEVSIDPTYAMDVLASGAGEYALADRPFVSFTQAEADAFCAANNLPQGTINAGVYIKAAFVHNASITSAQIKDLAADKITAGSINVALDLTAGSITGGLIEGALIRGGDIRGGSITADPTLGPASISGATISGGEIAGSRIWAGGTSALPNIEVDGATGALSAYSPDLLDGEPRRKTVVDDGNVVNYVKIPTLSGYQSNRALQRMDFGTASAQGGRVYLSGYWESQPAILVSPNSLQLYNAAAGNANQRIDCYADDVRRGSSDPNTAAYYTYSFQPVARIAVDGSSGYTPVLGTATLVDVTFVRTTANQGPRFLGSWSSATGTVPQYVTGGSLTVTYAMVDVTDYNSYNAEADLYQGYVTFMVYVGGVLTWSTTVLSGVDPVTTTFSLGALPAGALQVVVSVSSYYKLNNSSYVYNHYDGKPRQLATIHSLNVTSSGGNYLATGTVNWLAVGR